MALRDEINNNLKTAMKAGKALEVETLRMLNAALKNREIEKKGRGEAAEITDGDVQEVATKEVKRRKEAQEIFTQAKRLDLAEKEQGEIAILSHYLPAQMSKEEVGAVIDRAIKSAGSDFGSVMKEAMKELKGKADGKLVGEIIKSKLS